MLMHGNYAIAGVRGGLRGIRLARNRPAVAGLAVAILVLFQLLHGQLPWLGHFEWIKGIRQESGLAWTAPLSSPALDEDGRVLDAALYEWRRGNWLCRLAGPVFAQTPDAVCAGSWRRLGPAHQLHDTIRQQGGGGFSVWHGALYFSVPEGDPLSPNRYFALWVPWTGAAFWAAAAAAAGLIWAVWPPASALARRFPLVMLPGCGLIIGAAAASSGGASATLAWAGLLLAALQALPQIRHARRRHSRLPAAGLALAGFAAAEFGLSAVWPGIGLVPDLSTMRMVKYLADVETDRPILLLVGSSLAQYGVDETALETALDAAGHPMTVIRLGFGGLSIPDRLYYIRQYLALAKRKPAAVLFEVSAYYDLKPLKQFEQNLFTRREITVMDAGTLRLSLEWVLGPEGDPSQRVTLAAELLAHFALHALQAGFLPNSAWLTALPANPARGMPPKTGHFTEAEITADLAAGQSGQTLSAEATVPGVPVAVPTRWVRQATQEATALFRAGGVTRFGFFAPPSPRPDEAIYARQFCVAMTDYPCIAAEDPALIAALGHDEDWLDKTHLQGPGRRLYTVWLAARLAATPVVP
jgi:hypothetical protein